VNGTNISGITFAGLLGTLSEISLNKGTLLTIRAMTLRKISKSLSQELMLLQQHQSIRKKLKQSNHNLQNQQKVQLLRQFKSELHQLNNHHEV